MRAWAFTICLSGEGGSLGNTGIARDREAQILKELAQIRDLLEKTGTTDMIVMALLSAVLSVQPCSI